MKTLYLASLLFSLTLLSGCQVELSTAQDDEDEKEVIEYIFYKSSQVETVSPSDSEYDLTITGADNKLDIKGDVRNLAITGEGNLVELIDKDDLSTMELVASGTLISAVDSHVDDIKIAGDGNQITVASCKTLVITGNDNQVISMADGHCEQIN